MKKQISIILVICAFGLVSYGQNRSLGASGKTVISTCRKPILQAGKPAVFVTFLRMETIKPSDPSDDQNNLFFKLTNNTCWPIYLDMSGVADRRYGDASLYYLIEDKKSGRNLSGRLYCHVCSFNAIRSGKSMVFSMPLREATRESLMKVRYEFKWETDQIIGDYESSNTIHTVAYYFSGLPDSVLPKADHRDY